MDRRYAIGVILLALASTLSFAASLHLSKQETHRADAIALVANQRVLSQRIAFLVAALDDAPTAGRADLRTTLKAALEEMRGVHEQLTGRREGSANLQRFTAPIEGVYFAGYLPFDNDVERFLSGAETIAATSAEGPAWAARAPIRAEVVAAGNNTMMQTHDLMVRIMAVEADAAVARAQRVDMALWGAVLTLLVLITLGIFRPMARRVERSVRELVEAESRAVAAATAAREAKEAKGHFLQAASHELKTPLNAISGFAEVLAANENGADDDALAQMQLASAHMAALLDTILDTHRADEGRLVLAQDVFDLEDPLAAAARIAQGLADRKGLRFESMLDLHEGAVVQGDAGRLRQLCLNLLDNAVKFTAEGGVRLEAYTEGSADDPRLTILVTDTGCGIAEDRQAAVFERFSASGDVLSRGGGGLGVGLSLSREIAELMGGEISLRSRPDAGTQVEVVMPLTLAERPPAALPDEATAPPSAGRVLIVDDNLPNRMVAEALIKPLCETTAQCEDGAAAVALAETEAFDLILMDISMPVMDGITATETIRGKPGPNQATPIVAVTAHVAKEEVPELLARGFQDVMHKPVRREGLEACLERWTRTQKVRTA